MNTNKVENDKVTIKTVPGYEAFEQVTTAGDVIEIIRGSILYHHTESLICLLAVDRKRHCNKRAGLEMVLDCIILNEAKMKAWQAMKGDEPMGIDEYKQLANGAVYFHDHQPKGVNVGEKITRDYHRVGCGCAECAAREDYRLSTLENEQ